MNAALVYDFEQPPRYTTFADPIPAEGERLVTVTAAGLHQIVKALANGTHYGSTGELSFIPGVDGVGRLEGRQACLFRNGTKPLWHLFRASFGFELDVDRAARRLG